MVELLEGQLTPWLTTIQKIYYQNKLPSITGSKNLKYASVVWKSILKVQPIFTQSFKFQIRNRKLTSFWHDHWALDRQLKQFFSELFIPSNKSEISIADFFRTDCIRNHLRNSKLGCSWKARNVLISLKDKLGRQDWHSDMEMASKSQIHSKIMLETKVFRTRLNRLAWDISNHTGSKPRQFRHKKMEHRMKARKRKREKGKKRAEAGAKDPTVAH